MNNASVPRHATNVEKCNWIHVGSNPIGGSKYYKNCEIFLLFAVFIIKFYEKKM